MTSAISRENEEYIDFQKYWLVLKRRWMPATATFVTVVTLTVLAALSRKPAYEAEARILIKSDQSSKLAGLNNEMGEIQVLTNESDPIATEAEILSSRPIIEKAIKQLNLRNDEGELLKYEDVVGSLTVKPITGTDLIGITYQDSEPVIAASVVNKVIELYREEDILSNRAEAAAARDFIARQLPKIEVTVAKAEADLRQFKTENKVTNLSEETNQNIAAIKTLENQIDETSAEFEDINSRFEQLGKHLGLSVEEATTISALSQTAIPKVATELQNVRIQLANQRDLFSENAPQIVSLKEKEAELETLLRGQIKQTRENEQIGSLENLKILNIGGEGRYDQSLINEFANLGVQRSGVSSKLAGLKNTLVAHKQRLETLPSLEEKQRELERRVEAAQSTYQTLLSKLQETQVAENQNVGNIRVTASAVVPEDPTGVSKKLIVAAGGVAAGLLGVAVAFLLDLQDRSIKNSKEAEEILGYPLQAVIPDWGKEASSLIKGRQENVPQLAASNTALVPINPININPIKESYPTLQAREVYQMLQTNLKFLSTDWEKRVIAIASSVPQEGKSAVVANLAESLARVGKRVLLVDADLRRPTQHHIWDLANTSGLSNVLMNEGEWQEAIQEVMPGLDVLSAGNIPDNPVPLLESEQMKNLIETVATSYDWVLFDTPPLGGMADTTIIGRMVDGLLMVVRPGVADYGSVMAAKKLLTSSGQNVLGIVANGVNLKNEPYGYGSFYALEERYNQ
jgi:capsular exopolysaccharide synthesis family protein